MDRRRFLKASSVLGVAAGASGCASSSPDSDSTAIAQPAPSGTNPFGHGVASGDPQDDRVILWTRVAPTTAGTTELQVDWWIGTSDDPSTAEQSGRLTTRADRDFTVKVDPAGLQPDTQYFYGFASQGWRSRVGRTRTLPAANVQSVRLAVTSCANHPQGYFNAYRAIAAQDLNAVLCLGDYLYEYAASDRDNSALLGRTPEPNREIISLSDYRLRHAQYKADEDLQDAHAAHPWIVVWDDHESANNSWSGGAQNHNPEAGEGPWSVRRADAIRAYYEWMPIREVPTGLFRSFRFGQLADLVMLDTRLIGRDEQGERDDFDTANDPTRSLLGPVQETLFLDHLSRTQTDQVQWKLVGQQVAFAPWFDNNQPFNADSWSGYRHSRRNVLNHITREHIDNVVILTGDVHSAWALEVPDDTRETSHAIELITPAVSSRPLSTTSEQLEQMVAAALQSQDHIKYGDGQHNGFLVVTVQPEAATAEWYHTGAATERGATVLGKTLRCASGSNTLV